MSRKQPEKSLSVLLSNIRDCLASRDDASIRVALHLLCGLMSRGFNLASHAPLVAQHVVNDLDEVETLAQMLMIQLAPEDSDACYQAINALIQAINSPKESRRIRAMKTLTTLNHPELANVIDTYLRKGMSDENPFVKKATVIGAANLATVCASRREPVKKLILKAFESDDPVIVAGCISACEILKEGRMIQLVSDTHIWPIMLQLDSWSQGRALHYLKGTKEGKVRSVLEVLLKSSCPSVVFETVQYFEDEPNLAIPPLIRLIYSDPAISLHAFVILNKISEKHPDALVPYANHFLPPQVTEHTRYLSVEILGHLGNRIPSKYLLKWALHGQNCFAVHHLGALQDSTSLKVLLASAGDDIAEVAAFYAAKISDQSMLASLLELEGPRSAVIAVFSDSCQKNHELSDALLRTCIDKFSTMSREAQCEAALLAARMVKSASSEHGAQYLELCIASSNQDVSKRAKILKMMIESSNEKLANTVWATRDPPPPAPPVIFVPV